MHTRTREYEQSPSGEISVQLVGPKMELNIDNAMQALEGFSFRGIGVYADRAVTLAGATVVIGKGIYENEAEGWIDYLWSLGLCADIIEVSLPENGDLYEAIENSPQTIQLIHDHVNNGFAIFFFNTRDEIEEEFIKRIGLSWRQVISPKSRLADRLNNKAEIRRIGPEEFPPHKITRGWWQTFKAFLKLWFFRKEVALKVTSWASGLGMKFTRSPREAYKFAREHDGKEMIVERSVGRDHIPFSIVLHFKKGKLIDKWFSQQECVFNEGQVAHSGNIIAKKLPRISGQQKGMIEIRARAFLEKLLTVQEREKISSIICFDGMITRTGKIYFCEINMRKTFSTYLQKTLNAIKEITGQQKAGMVMTIKEIKCRSFKEIQKKLGERMYSHELGGGIIPVMIRCLPEGYCAFFAIGDDAQEVMQLMQEAQEIVCK